MKTEAEKLREEAGEHWKNREESFQRSDTDRCSGRGCRPYCIDK